MGFLQVLNKYFQDIKKFKNLLTLRYIYMLYSVNWRKHLRTMRSPWNLEARKLTKKTIKHKFSESWKTSRNWKTLSLGVASFSGSSSVREQSLFAKSTETQRHWSTRKAKASSQKQVSTLYATTWRTEIL